MTSSSPNPAWPLRSDAENAGRALALRAALDFAISPQQQRRGMWPTEERVLELAEKFAAWLADAEPAHFSGGTDIGDLQPTDTGHACDEAEALEAADPVIDAYIESDKRVMALTEHLLAEQRKLAQRMIHAELKVEQLLRNQSRRLS